MTKAAFWRQDWFLGVVVAFVLLFATGTQIVQSLERTAYDWGVRASSRNPSDKVVVIAIDDASIRSIGRWPWSRDVHAKMAEILASGNAKVVGNLVFFSEPQVDAGLTYIQKLVEVYNRAAGGGTPGGVLGEVGAVLQEAELALNTDRRLAESYTKAGNILLPILFEIGDPRGKPDKPLPDFVLKNQLTNIGRNSDETLLPTSSVLSLPIDSIGTSVSGVGHLNASIDVDGGIRGEPLVLQFFDQFYPSLSVMFAAKSLNLAVTDIKVRLGEGVSIGNLKIATDPSLQMNTYFYKDRDGKSAFRVDSFFDVYSGKLKADSFRDKIVLIGPTAAGVGTTSVTPVSPAMAPVLTTAHAVSSILQEHFFVVPSWAFYVEKLVFLLVAAYLIALLPRLKAGTGAAISAGLAAAAVRAQGSVQGRPAPKAAGPPGRRHRCRRHRASSCTCAAPSGSSTIDHPCTTGSPRSWRCEPRASVSSQTAPPPRRRTTRHSWRRCWSSFGRPPSPWPRARPRPSTCRWTCTSHVARSWWATTAVRRCWFWARVS